MIKPSKPQANNSTITKNIMVKKLLIVQFWTQNKRFWGDKSNLISGIKQWHFRTYPALPIPRPWILSEHPFPLWNGLQNAVSVRFTFNLSLAIADWQAVFSSLSASP